MHWKGIRQMRFLRKLWKDQTGSQLVEAALVFTPMFAMVFLLVDVGWSIFVKATLQAAVREGARYAMTGRTSTGGGQLSSVKSVVQNYAMGLLDGGQSGTITIQFYTPDTLTPTASNQGGNLVVVSVVNYPFTPLAPFLHAGQTVYLTVSSGDRLETLPGGASPAL